METFANFVNDGLVHESLSREIFFKIAVHKSLSCEIFLKFNTSHFAKSS